ncbi:MAG: hypothetical protein CSA75_00195 [Sorangium cellulosum]|nr:MAG: hypothetical protein CSA75_00195 [Sorangium cellulosum]
MDRDGRYSTTVFRPALFALAVSLAPYQCQSNDPKTRNYESPGDGLYDLAQEFRAKGQDEAYKETLRFIIERYPSSRRAVTAKSELEAMGG